MADFAGLLKKTIDAQNNPTPQLRARIYERARDTIKRKLAVANVSDKVTAEQLAALETAISDTEAHYLAVEKSLLEPLLEKSPVLTEKRQSTNIAEKLKLAENAKTDGVVTHQDDLQKMVDPSFGEATQKAKITEQKSDADKVETSDKVLNDSTQINKSNLELSDKISVSQAELKSSALLDDNASKSKQSLVGNKAKLDTENRSPKNIVAAAEPVNLDDVLIAEKQQEQKKIEEEQQVKQVVSVHSAEPTQTTNAATGEYDIVSDIFVQAAKRGERKAAKRHAFVVGISIIAIFLIVAVVVFTAWEFLSSKQKTVVANIPADQNGAGVAPKTVEKLNQRLMPDGTEVDMGPAQSTPVSAEGTSSATATNAAVITGAPGEAILYMAKTAEQNEKAVTGNVAWSLVKEASAANGAEETAIRGDVTIPDENLTMRFIVRRNTDQSLPAAYIIEISLNVPESFSGKSFDKLQDFSFKATEQSIGQSFGGAGDLVNGVASAKIGENFFYYALSNIRPYLDTNLYRMRNLDWIRFVLVDKNGRVNELTLSKGPKGKAIFDQVINEWLKENNKPTVYDENKAAPTEATPQ